MFSCIEAELLELHHHAGVVELELDHSRLQAALILQVLGELG
jgi:hypothetical protein